MVTVQEDLHKSEGWNPAVYLSVLEKCLAGASEGKAPVSEGMYQWSQQRFGRGSWNGRSICLLLRFLNFKKERRAGLQVTPVACLLLPRSGQLAFSTPYLSQGEGNTEAREEMKEAGRD